jgi:hypothetical protein
MQGIVVRKVAGATEHENETTIKNLLKPALRLSAARKSQLKQETWI